MERVVVTGPAGAGKSHLANELGRRLGGRVVHLDTLFWKPGWVPTPPEEWDALQRRELAADAWILDSQFDDMHPGWLAAADTVVFVDASLVRCLWRVAQRRLNRDESVGVPSGTEPGPLHHALLKFARNQWRYRTSVRRQLLVELERAQDGRRVVVLRGADDTARFLGSLDSRGSTGGTM